MDLRHLVSAGSLAQSFGVKMIGYGLPGSGKTPVIQTAPRPVSLVVEPGLLSMRGSNTPIFRATNSKQIDEFFEWCLKSAEMKNFDTICTDSGSEIAEIVLREKFASNKDGRKAYGEMSKQCEDWFNGLYYLPQKHVYIICKQQTEETVESSFSAAGVPQIQTFKKVKPYFPGQDLPMKVSHKYDLIVQATKHPAGAQAFRCKETNSITARDRSGKLDEYEEFNLSKLFAKAMS